MREPGHEDITSFNSIKVRLRPARGSSGAGATKFQFHKGTIKTVLAHAAHGNARRFQFHKGTIKTLNDEVQAQEKKGFNSIKVRLRLKIGRFDAVYEKFQFHKGTIKTLCG